LDIDQSVIDHLFIDQSLDIDQSVIDHSFIVLSVIVLLATGLSITDQSSRDLFMGDHPLIYDLSAHTTQFIVQPLNINRIL
jgi:hypothetical protein